MVRDEDLTARIEPFDSYWEAPADIEKGYSSVGRFYARNYLPHVPGNREANILVISCGPGYMVKLLGERGYSRVVGIDSSEEKIAVAKEHGLPCRVSRIFEYLRENTEPRDLIFAEQEINHLTKTELLDFLAICQDRLAPGGVLIMHSINGANPMTGSESRAGNFDHYSSFTDYSLAQVLTYAGFREVQVLPLHLYVFYLNPLNYVAWGLASLSFLVFRGYFRLLGKNARIFTKKIGAVARVA